MEDSFRPAAKAHPAFSVADVDALFARFGQHGVPCTWDRELENMRRFYASDPWENRLEFTEPTALNSRE